MAIAFDTSVDGGFTTSITSKTWTHVCTGSNLLLVVGLQASSSQASNNITGVTYNSVAMTQLFVTQLPSGDYIHYWYLANASSGSNSVTVSATSSTYIGGVSASYTGVATSSPLEDSKSVTNSSNSALSTSGLTVTTANDWRIEVFGSAGSGSDPTSSDTKRIVNGSVYVSIWDSNAALGTGTRDITFTPAAGAARNGIFAATLKIPSSTFTKTATVTVSNAASRVMTVLRFVNYKRPSTVSVSNSVSRLATVAKLKAIARRASVSVSNSVLRYAVAKFKATWTRQSKSANPTYTTQSKSSSSWTTQNKS